ncbi:MAG TPA: hypothetical protein VNN10_10960 [Dehalococcoidia bacterium]|nr:hypothetical protein [Dehalococcoidia bacterium]
MSEAASSARLTVQLEERTYPPYDPFHGTNWPMRWRQATIETPLGMARLEQTDYGHPGRLNPWEPRSVPVSLAAKTPQLLALAEAAGALLD